MSIATNIDGSAGSTSQLFDLLTVVSNPTVYQEKIKALESAIAENKKYVDLIGPTSDILALREKTREETVKASDLLKNAKVEAKSIVSDAENKAANIIAAAQKKAADLEEQAQQVLDSAVEIKKEATKAVEQAKTAKAKSDTAITAATNKAQELEVAIAKAKQAEDEAKAVKAEILAKHSAFIASL